MNDNIGVYVIYRDDLRLAYVGQSIDLERRIRRHRTPRSATRLTLFDPPGETPRVVTHPCPPDELNDREYEMFATVQAEGYTLVNPATRREHRTVEQRRAISAQGAAISSIRAGRLGGLNGGHRGGLAVAAIRRKCLECGMVSTPMGISSHRKASGHVHYEDLRAEGAESTG